MLNDFKCEILVYAVLNNCFWKLKDPQWEGLGRLKAEPTKKQFHWYEKQDDRP
jgi:hypothetical protein